MMKRKKLYCYSLYSSILPRSASPPSLSSASLCSALSCFVLPYPASLYSIYKVETRENKGKCRERGRKTENSTIKKKIFLSLFTPLCPAPLCLTPLCKVKIKRNIEGKRGNRGTR
jgi:hypothetical protein